MPLLFLEGLDGFAVGMILASAALVVVRLFYLRRLFSLRPILVNSDRRRGAGARWRWRRPAALRLALWGGERTEAQAILEVAVFSGVTVAVTLATQRALLQEFRGYLRRA